MTNQTLRGSGALPPSRAQAPGYVASDNLVAFAEWALAKARHEIASGDMPTMPLNMPGLGVDVISANRKYTELARARLYSHEESLSRERISVAVLSPDDSAMPSTPAWGEATYHPREVEKLLEDTPFRATYFHDEQLWQIYDRRARFGLQWMRGGDSYPPWDSGAPLRVFLHWAYRFSGRRLVHAGTLGRNGHGILLAGKGGSGKSGTVVGGAHHGLDSVGDDYVLVESQHGRTTAYPLFETLKQDAEGLRRLGLWDSISDKKRPNWQSKYEMNFGELGTKLARQLEIGAVVVPRVTHAPATSLVPLSRARAMLALAPTGLMQLPGERESGVAFFSQLVRTTTCFELLLGTDAREVSRVIAAFIEGGFRCD